MGEDKNVLINIYIYIIYIYNLGQAIRTVSEALGNVSEPPCLKI